MQVNLAEPPRSDMFFMRFALIGWALTLLNSAVGDKLVILTSTAPSMTMRVALVATWGAVEMLVAAYAAGGALMLPVLRCTLMPFGSATVRLIVRVAAVTGCVLVAGSNLWQTTAARRVEAGPLWWVYGHQIVELCALAVFIAMWHNEQQLRREREMQRDEEVGESAK